MTLLSSIVLALSLSSPVVAANPQVEQDLSAQVQQIFSAKCTQCHGPQLPRPRGKFGYVLDLKRVAANPKIVVPYRPADSKLWNLVEEEKMPPDEAQAGPLTEPEKESIRAWIEAGAPSGTLAPTPPAAALAPPAVAVVTAERPAPPFLNRLLRLIGKLHILVIHFPIALLTAAAVGEGWAVWRRHPGPSPIVRFCVLLGAVGAVSAAGLGWLHATFNDFGTDQALTIHGWMGTLASAGAAGIAIISEREAHSGQRTRPFRILLVLGVLLIAVAAHLGGTLVYGEDYFKW